jgi:hypothetical protein
MKIMMKMSKKTESFQEILLKSVDKNSFLLDTEFIY